MCQDVSFQILLQQEQLHTKKKHQMNYSAFHPLGLIWLFVNASPLGTLTSLSDFNADNLEHLKKEKVLFSVTGGGGLCAGSHF